MKVPKFDLGDTVISDARHDKEVITVDTMVWHVGYGQWHVNKGEDTECFTHHITHRYSKNKEKWIKL